MTQADDLPFGRHYAQSFLRLGGKTGAEASLPPLPHLGWKPSEAASPLKGQLPSYMSSPFLVASLATFKFYP